MSSAYSAPRSTPPDWLARTIAVSLLVHALALLTLRGLQRDVPPPDKLIEVELQRPEVPPPPPPAALPPPPPPARVTPVTPPPPLQRTLPQTVPPTPVLTAPPEAPPRPEQPVIQRPPEPPVPVPAPVPPPPPVAPPPAHRLPAPAAVESPIDQNELRRGFVRSVSGAVAKQRRYPQLAARKGWQGEVQLRVVVDGNGHLLEVSVQESSGFEVLDREAVEMVRRAAPFPLLAGMKKEDFAITLPVQFRLEPP